MFPPAGLHDADTDGRYLVARLSVSQLPGFQQLLKLGRERKDALFLDIGCCCTWICLLLAAAS